VDTMVLFGETDIKIPNADSLYLQSIRDIFSAIDIEHLLKIASTKREKRSKR
jgi:hypothetical protein